MKSQLILAALIMGAFAASNDFNKQDITVTSWDAFLSTSAEKTLYDNFISGKGWKTPYDFWAAWKSTCSTAKAYDNTEDNQDDKWAALFNAQINTHGICNTFWPTVPAGGGLQSSDDAFAKVPFHGIQCYWDLVNYEKQYPSTKSKEWLKCFKGALDGIGYNTDDGLWSIWFTQSVPEFTESQITASELNNIATAAEAGKNTNARYAVCARECDSQAAFTEVGTTDTYWNGDNPQQYHANQVSIAKANCSGAKAAASLSPSAEFSSTQASALQKCYDALVPWFLSRNDQKKAKCYVECANPALNFDLPQEKSTNDGEVRSEDGEFVAAKRRLIGEFSSCINKVTRSTHTALPPVKKENVWVSAHLSGTQANPLNSANFNEMTQITNQNKDYEWQTCLKRYTSCIDFKEWARKDWEFQVAYPRAAGWCIENCIPKPLTEYGNNEAEQWEGANINSQVHGLNKQAKASMDAQVCLTKFKDGWNSAYYTWRVEQGGNNSGSIITFASIFALVIALIL